MEGVGASLEEPVEKAENRPLNKDYVFKQLSKLGDTDYELKYLDIIADEDAFLPASSLNKMRRDAVDRIFKRMRNHKVNYNENFKEVDQPHINSCKQTQ